MLYTTCPSIINRIMKKQLTILLVILFSLYGCSTSSVLGEKLNPKDNAYWKQKALHQCGEKTQSQKQDMIKNRAVYTCSLSIGEWIKEDGTGNLVRNQQWIFEETPVILLGIGKCHAQIDDIVGRSPSQGLNEFRGRKNKDILPFKTYTWNSHYGAFQTRFHFPKLLEENIFYVSLYINGKKVGPYPSDIYEIRQESDEPLLINSYNDIPTFFDIRNFILYKCL